MNSDTKRQKNEKKRKENQISPVHLYPRGKREEETNNLKITKQATQLKPHAHCVKNSFFFLTIISKHICTTPFDCFDREW